MQTFSNFCGFLGCVVFHFVVTSDFFHVITLLNAGQVTRMQCWYASPLTKLNSLITFISKAL